MLWGVLVNFVATVFPAAWHSQEMLRKMTVDWKPWPHWDNSLLQLYCNRAAVWITLPGTLNSIRHGENLTSLLFIFMHTKLPNCSETAINQNFKMRTLGVAIPNVQKDQEASYMVLWWAEVISRSLSCYKKAREFKDHDMRELEHSWYIFIIPKHLTVWSMV